MSQNFYLCYLRFADIVAIVQADYMKNIEMIATSYKTRFDAFSGQTSLCAAFLLPFRLLP